MDSQIQWESLLFLGDLHPAGCFSCLFLNAAHFTGGALHEPHILCTVPRANRHVALRVPRRTEEFIPSKLLIFSISKVPKSPSKVLRSKLTK